MARRPKQRSLWTLIFGLTAVAYLLTHFFDEDDGPPSPTPTACSSNDGACVAARLAPAIQGPCSQALQRHMGVQVTWRAGFLESRFENGTWYSPPEHLIYYGRALEIPTISGIQKPAYYCVTDRSGRVQKVGLQGQQKMN